MRFLTLHGGGVAFIDDEDYEAAQLYTWRTHKPSHPRTRNTTYAVATIEKKRVYLHLWLWKRWGRPAVPVVDHRNADGLDCTRDNLRDANVTQNNRNRGRTRLNTSGAKGVYWSASRKRWHAQISVDGRRLHLGYFTFLDEAAAAYDRAALLHHGEFAQINGGQHGQVPSEPDRGVPRDINARGARAQQSLDRAGAEGCG